MKHTYDDGYEAKIKGRWRLVSLDTTAPSDASGQWVLWGKLTYFVTPDNIRPLKKRQRRI